MQLKIPTPDSFKDARRRLKSEKNPVEDFRSMLEKFYDLGENTEERMDMLLDKIKLFEEFIDPNIISKIEIRHIRNNLLYCEDIDKKDKFVSKILGILEPIFEIKRKYPKEYEEAQAKISNKELGYIELNRLVTYEKVGDVIKIHHSKAFTIGAKLKVYISAMKELAKVVESDPRVKKIEAVSWIVYKIPALFTKYGFTVEKLPKYSIDSMSVQSGNEKDPEGHPIAMATISREDFIKQFLDNDIK